MATMTQMAFTPGAGPSSAPMSRSTSSSSHVDSNSSISDDEEEWLGQLRAEVQQNQKARLADLIQQAEEEFQRASTSLAARRDSNGYDHLSLEAYDTAKAKLYRAFDAQKLKVKRLLEEEAKMVIEQERALRKLSLGGDVDSEDEQAKAVIAEQEKLLKMYEARAHRSGSVDVRDTDTTPQASATSQPTRWKPPARPLQAQKSNTSDTPSVRRGSSTASKPTSNLTSGLYANQHRSSGPSYQSWMSDSPFPSAEPEDMTDLRLDEAEVETDNDFDESDYNNEDGAESTDNGDGGHESDSGSDDDYGNMTLGGKFLLSAEGSFDIAHSAPLNIIRGGTHQSSIRGRPAGRTPPSATLASYSTHTTPVRMLPNDRGQSHGNSQGIYWKPSRENLGSTRATPTYNVGTTQRPSLNRRPSAIDPTYVEQKKVQEAERSWEGIERARNASGLASGAPGTSASPPIRGLSTSASGTSSIPPPVQGPAQRTAEGSTKVWRPRENKASIPTTSNVSVTANAGGITNANNPATPISATSGSPGANAYMYRPRNDSDTSAGSPARRPSQSQSFMQPTPSPKPSLPIPTPGTSATRRSPVPSFDSHMPIPSPPTSLPSTSISASRPSSFLSNQRSPSPPPIPIPNSSLSRQPTEIINPDAQDQPGQDPRSNWYRTRSRAKSRTADDSEIASVSPNMDTLNERTRESPSHSALSERIAKQRDLEADKKQKEREESLDRQREELRQRELVQSRREAQLSSRLRSRDNEAAEQQKREYEEQQRKLREDLLEEQRAAQERATRQIREEVLQAQHAREAEFAEQQRVLEAQRQREAELRQQKEMELAEKEDELNRHRREMAEWRRVREEEEITEQIHQLELQKQKETALEEQQRLLEAQRQVELETQRRKEKELKQKVEELKRHQRELVEAQRRKEEKEREEALRREEEEQAAAEQRKKEDELRAKEDELKRQQWALHQREEALTRRRKEEELRAKEEELERQRKELQQREEELARREEEDERRRSEEKARKERESALRRQQEEEDKKRVEDAVMRKLEKDKELEQQEREAKERLMREREERERERNNALRVRERPVHRGREEGRKQEEFEQRARDTARRRMEDEQGRVAAEELKQQEELLRFYEQRKHQEEARKRDPKGASNSFSSSIPNPIGTFSSASGSFPPGRAASSASSIHSNWSGSQRSSASSTSAASDFSRASATSSATSAWSTGSRPTPSSTSSSGSNRTATGESYKASGAWRSNSAAGTGSGPSPSSGGGAGSYTQSSPLSEAEWHRRQEENARKQQEQFRRDSLRAEQERAAQAAAAATSTAGGREQVQRAWATYESAWATLKDRPALFFRSIPWPVLRQPSDVEELTANAIGAFILSPVHSGDKTSRDRLKEQLLRWHPDRFESKWLSKVDGEEKEIVRRGAGQVVRGLNELMARENSNPFS